MSSVLAAWVALVAPGIAAAQQAPQAQGFALDRLYLSAPGAGWFVMDTLDMRGGLGGAMEMTTSYAHRPLVVTDGTQHVPVVSDQTYADFGFAATYDRYRLYLNLQAPLYTQGPGGTVGGYQFPAPSVDLGTHPDALADARIGLDARILGEARSPFRLGASAQLFIANDLRSYANADGGTGANYDTDGTPRAMIRGLFAGDQGWFTYAGQLGVHVRPLDDAPIAGSPRGSELLFGLAAGAKLPLPWSALPSLVVGPELYGATAFEGFFGTTTTALESLLSGRIEGQADAGAQLRVKLGAGGGLDPHFGAPQWRAVLAVEVFDHGAGRKLP